MEKGNFARLIILFVAASQLELIYCQVISESFTDQRFVIAVLLPIHNIEFTFYEEGTMSISRGAFVNEYMLQLAEAAYYAKDLIDKDNELLPNITLDVVVKDYTDFPGFGNQNNSKLFEELCWFGNWIQLEANLSCSQNQTSHLIGIIYSDDMEVQPKFQTFLQSFPLVPHISYSGPKKDMLVNENIRLERSGKFRTFNAISSGSIFIIDVIFEMLIHYNWTYVALQYSSDGYDGVRYAKRFQEMAAENGICIAHVMDTKSLRSIIKSKKNLWQVVPSYNTIQVIVCICDAAELAYLQHALIGDGSRNNSFVVVVGNGKGAGLPRYLMTTSNWRPGLVNINFIIPRATTIRPFNDYYLSKTVQNNSRNPWYREFWEQRFRCKFQPTINEEKCNETMQRRDDPNVNNTYQQYSEVANVMKSVYTLAHSLHDTLSQGDWQEYPGFWNKLANYVNEANFTLFEDEVSFTYDGLPRTETFEMYGFHDDFSKVLFGEYVKSGYLYYINQNREKNIQSFLYYRRTLGLIGELLINDSLTLFPSDIRQTCSEPCPPGHATIRQIDTCCWKCDPCDSTEILNDTSICTRCDHGSMSNDEKTACIPIPVKKSNWHDIESLISASFSLICIILTIFTSAVFIKHRDTPAVKSTTRELCHVMFAGMILANFTPFVSILSLDAITCGLIRYIPAISFTMIYAALLVKTNRIARLLAISKKKFPNMNPKFMSLQAQIVITFALVAIELIICSISLYYHQPEAVIDYILVNDYTSWYGSETCNLDPDVLIETYVFVTLLVILCTNYAIKTRNLPLNFNEAKCIGFAMYATLLTGMAFALVYFNSEKQMLAINLSVSINSLVVLIFLFAPKLYIILYKPEKNVKANFVLETHIRSYQGNEKRSDSKPHRSNNLSMKKIQSKANVSKEKLQKSMKIAATELFKVLDADNHMRKSKPIEELGDVENSNTAPEMYNDMIKKLKSFQMELNRLQKEVIE